MKPNLIDVEFLGRPPDARYLMLIVGSVRGGAVYTVREKITGCRCDERDLNDLKKAFPKSKPRLVVARG
jgi:hypothetical protein